MRRYVRQKEVAARSVAGMNLLVPVHGCTDRVFTLNEVGRRLWTWLESPLTEAELASRMQAEYGVSRETALRDATLFLDDMVQKGLVSKEETPDP